jgi:hypothetical protein
MQPVEKFGEVGVDNGLVVVGLGAREVSRRREPGLGYSSRAPRSAGTSTE